MTTKKARLEAVLEAEGEQLLRAAITKARAGDVPALRTCLDRLMPSQKERMIRVELRAKAYSFAALSRITRSERSTCAIASFSTAKRPQATPTLRTLPKKRQRVIRPSDQPRLMRRLN